jgi:hypothetical protein
MTVSSRLDDAYKCLTYGYPCGAVFFSQLLNAIRVGSNEETNHSAHNDSILGVVRLVVLESIWLTVRMIGPLVFQLVELNIHSAAS